jgi:7,8-dihydropterin-6-yl-methyl-4-(beta-D-ribofuranosyl)aminobenzene 5'-phosphate synthase
MIKITTLSENYSGVMKGILAEHGLSILVETRDAKILFDTGQSISLIHNMNVLRVNPREVSKVVLSHGHYDHTGGLRSFLERVDEVEVFSHPDIFQKKYKRLKIGSEERYRYIGIPFNRSELESMGATFNLKKNPVKVMDGIFTTGEVERRSDFEKGDPNLFVQEKQRYTRDKLLDDQGLVVRSDKGLIVLLGCAHSGVVNTIAYVKEVFNEEVFAILGGTHLSSVGEHQIKDTIKYFKRIDVKRIGVSHCTGLEVARRLGNEFKRSFFYNNTGKVFTL